MKTILEEFFDNNLRLKDNSGINCKGPGYDGCLIARKSGILVFDRPNAVTVGMANNKLTIVDFVKLSFFVWDPIVSYAVTIPCPNDVCDSHLKFHGWPSLARRALVWNQ